MLHSSSFVKEDHGKTLFCVQFKHWLNTLKNTHKIFVPGKGIGVRLKDMGVVDKKQFDYAKQLNSTIKYLGYNGIGL